MFRQKFKKIKNMEMKKEKNIKRNKIQKTLVADQGNNYRNSSPWPSREVNK